MRLDVAIDRYIGDLARQGKSPTTRRTYRFKLDGLCDRFENIEDVTPLGCAQYLDRWQNRSVATIAQSVTIVTCFFRWAVEHEYIDRSPAEKLKRPRLQRPEELDVVTISNDDVRRLLNGCETWPEALCISVLAYLGARRRAASMLRWRDLDLDRETARFKEKGGKVITKPLPHELAALLRYAKESKEVPSAPDDYVVPMVRKQLKDGERDARVIWRTVVRVSNRVGVKAHAHAMRAAFAVHYLETHVGDLEALQALMGHNKIETTQVYLRRFNREQAMERVRDLSWGAPLFDASPVKAPSGVEPLWTALQAAA